MATQIEVINRALVLLAVEPIQSLEDDSAEARVAVRLWEDLYKKHLARRWKFARVTTGTLAKDPSTSPEGYSRWVLPSTRLILVGLVDESGDELAYRIEGNLAIVEETGSPTAVYATWVKDPGIGNCPSYWVVAFSHALAAEAAMTLTENSTLAEGWRASAEDLWKEARVADAQQGGTDAVFNENEATMFWGR